MNHWLENSVKNLLPLSRATDFKEALQEWFFTGNVDDHEGEDADISCELCEHPDLVHHYHIKNSQTDHSLLVGSSCILKFEQIEIRDEFGRPITDSNLRSSALASALRAKVIESALTPLRKLWKIDSVNRYQIEYLAQEIKRDAGINPRELIGLIKDLEKRQIAHRTSVYKLNLRSDFAKTEVMTMTPENFTRIEKAFSREQLRKARALRNEA